MELTNEDIKELQEIFKSDYGKELSFEEAKNEGSKLISLMQIVLDLP